MFQLNYYTLFPVFILLFSLHLSIIHGSDKIVENFHDFSESLEESFSESPEASETRPGVHFFNSFGVGYTLANIQEGVWNISAKGIPSALKTMEKYIPDDYGHLLRLFKKVFNNRSCHALTVCNTIPANFRKVQRLTGGGVTLRNWSNSYVHIDWISLSLSNHSIVFFNLDIAIS